MRTETKLPHGIQLLQQLVEWLPYGRVFTSEEALEAGRRLGLSPAHVLKLLSAMSASGAVLVRPRRGLYVMCPPFGGRDEVRPTAIAVRAVEPSAVAGQTALAHWGLIDQAPMKYETLVTPAALRWSDGLQRRDRATRWTWDGHTFEYRHVRDREMFGIRLVRLDSETDVPMFDRERSLLEEVLRAPMSGAAIVADHRDEVDLRLVATYARQAGPSAVALVESVLGRIALAA
jgi:predicted transcriptional regulator of viral defense system